MRGRAPEAASWLEKGEALAGAGSFEGALEAFRKGEALDPYSVGLFERRECEALTSLDRTQEAQAICYHAVQDLRTPSAIEATVRALVSGTKPPPFSDVSTALVLASRERLRAPKNPNLAAAMCDIAESIGDAIMLQHCSEELESIAPNYGPTRRAQEAIARQCPPWRFWGGWLSIAALTALTGVDALRRWLQRRSSGLPSIRGLAAAVLVLGSLAFSSAAHAAEGDHQWLSKWPIDDQDPAKSVPKDEDLKADPLQAGYFLQDLIAKAELASKAGEHGAAIKYYEALLKAVPTRAISLTKMCSEFEAMGNLKQAQNSCGLALALDGVTVGDYAHFVHLMLREQRPLTDQEILALNNVIDHMKHDDAGRQTGYELQCEVAIRASDTAKLSECAAALAVAAPNDQKTLMYEWDLAVREHHFAKADELMEQAKAAGMKADGLRRMELATHEARSKRYWMFGLLFAGGLTLLTCLVYALLAFAKRRGAPAPVAASPAT